MNRRPRLIAGLLAASVLVLTGCGASGPRPGVAVAVGDEVVTEQTVDTASRGLCSFFADEIASGEGVVAYREVRRNVAVLLALRAAVDELAEETGAGPGSDYRRRLADLERDAADLQPASEREALVTTLGSEPYVLAMVPAIGEALLRAEGQAEPDVEAANRRGLEALTDYLSGADVEFSPALGLAYQDLQLPPANADVTPGQVIGALFDTREFSTSVGVSETAEQARERGPEYAATLPENQRCGG